MRFQISSRVAAVLIAIAFVVATLAIKQLMLASNRQDTHGSTVASAASIDTTNLNAHEKACIPFITMTGDLIKYQKKMGSVSLDQVLEDIDNADAAASFDSHDVSSKILNADNFIRNEITGKSAIIDQDQIQAEIDPAINACSH